MKLFNNLSLVIAGFGGFICQFLGGYDSLLKAIITLIVIDYVSGLIKSAYNKKLSSGVGFKGIIKKIMILVVIATAVVIQTVIKTSIPIREITIVFFITNEGLSILENAIEFIPIPQKIKDLLIQVRGDNDDGTGDSDRFIS